MMLGWTQVPSRVGAEALDVSLSTRHAWPVVSVQPVGDDSAQSAPSPPSCSTSSYQRTLAVGAAAGLAFTAATCRSRAISHRAKAKAVHCRRSHCQSLDGGAALERAADNCLSSSLDAESPAVPASSCPPTEPAAASLPTSLPSESSAAATAACIQWAQQVPVSRRASTAAAALVASGLVHGGPGAQVKPAHAVSDVTTTDKVEKSPLDTREYRVATLKNGLRVLLVSDKNAEVSATALNVHAGSFCDPPEIPGLAHLCERTLLLANDLGKDTNLNFPQYVRGRGGAAGSFTNTKDSCFYFSCAQSDLVSSLEKFVTFFQAASFPVQAIKDETEMIEAEHNSNLKVDLLRLSQLFSARATPEHPFHRFPTGNQLTLLEEPQRRGYDMQVALRSHKASYYVTSLMTLCILSKDSLDSMLSAVMRIFKGLATIDNQTVPFPGAGINPFPATAFQVAFEAQPAEDTRCMQVAFPIQLLGTDADVEASRGGELFEDVAATTLENWRYYNPLFHVGSVVGYEGVGSMCAMFRKRGWATSVRMGVLDESETFAIMLFTIDLTSAGLAKRLDVLDVVFGYLKFLDTLGSWPQELLRESFLLSDASWRCLKPSPAGESSVRFATNMSLYTQPDDFVGGGSRLKKGTGLNAAIKDVSEALVPKNALIMFTGKELSRGGNLKEIEPWYGTKYGKVDVASYRQRWNKAGLEPGLGLPPPNPYLPENLELKAPRGPAPAKPVARRQDPRWQTYFLQDTEAGVPKAQVRIALLTSAARSSPKAAVMCRVLQAMVESALTETILYDAKVAGLNFAFSSSSSGIQLFFSGYNHKLLLFARAVVRAIVTFDPSEQSIICDTQRDELDRQLKTLSLQEPWQQADYLGTLGTAVKDFSIKELSSALEATSADDIDDFSLQLWRKEPFHALALCQGNLTQSEADDIITAVDGVLRFSALPQQEWPKSTMAMLPVSTTGPGYALISEATGALQQDSGVHLLFQLGMVKGSSGIDKFAKAKVLSVLLQKRLRTIFQDDQKVCSVVKVSAACREGVVELSVLAQASGSVGPVELASRINASLASFQSELKGESMSEGTGQGLVASLQKTSQSLADAALKRPKSLDEAVESKWSEVISREYFWERAAEEAAVFKKITSFGMAETLTKSIVAGKEATERRNLVALVFGAKHRQGFATAEKELKEAGARSVMKNPRKLAGELPTWA